MRFFLWTVMIMSALWGDASTRPPAVAGAFYPGGESQLRSQVEGLLEGAKNEEAGYALAVVVPHAGYVYSGATAARAFALLDGKSVERVILLGPSHYASFSGGALPAAKIRSFTTPLGEVAVDTRAVEGLRSSPRFAGPASAHDREHCLEVELPFLQVVAPRAQIVPILVGQGTDRSTATAMARELSSLLGPGTAVVVSTDFSHHGAGYGWAPFANDGGLGDRLLELGKTTAERVASVDATGFWQQVEVSGDTVCGKRPIGVAAELLDHAFEGTGRVEGVTTSGHVSGSFDQSVTYASVSFAGKWTGWREERSTAVLGRLSAKEETAVLELARATFKSHLEHDASLAEWFAGHPELGQMAARSGAFVTVHNQGKKARSNGRLRACMGVIEAREPLVDAVIHSAVSAAHDPRFPELSADELEHVHLEVSILSPTTAVSSFREIEVGTHGVLLHKAGRSAVFLPQVATEQGWDRVTMLEHLSRKAGLSADGWRSGATFEVFTAQVFAEPE